MNNKEVAIYNYFLFTAFDRLDENVFEQISFFSMIALGQPVSWDAL